MSARNLLLGLLACASVQAFATVHAFAEEAPAAGRKDPRMRSVVYDPDQVVRLSTGVGATLVVTFAATEKITTVAVTDSKDLVASPRENFLFVKSKVALPPQPVIVLTQGPKGTRRYVFEVETVTMVGLTADKSDLYYSVQFSYPRDDADARAEDEKRRQADRRGRAADLALNRGHDGVTDSNAATSASPNWHYVGQGDQTLLPIEIFDDGYTTSFRFPGNTRVPGIFRIDPDGKESTANYTMKGEYAVVGSVAAGWRLRDGNTVLCIWNRAYDKIGTSPHTGTTSPDVTRVTKEPPK